MLLIDVRNRTELNEVGQIPGSVCLPLHEVEAAFRDLDTEEFKERQVGKKIIESMTKFNVNAIQVRVRAPLRREEGRGAHMQVREEDQGGRQDSQKVHLLFKRGRGGKSSKYGHFSRRLGYGNLRLYSGSFKDWVRRGGETFLAGYDLDYNILS